MGRDHTIREGECIFSIAARYGHSWETIWEAPENDGLRKQRRHPGVLLAGDHVSIPDLTPKTFSLAPSQRHKFVVPRSLITVRLRLMQPPHPAKSDPAAVTTSADHKTVTFEDPPPPEKTDDAPRKNAAWEVRVDAVAVASGQTDGDGQVEFKLEPHVKAALLVVEPGTPNELHLPLALGALDAYDGQINRLRIGRVLRTVTKHLDASRSAILVQLTGNQVFLEQDLRTDLLIRACSALRPSPPEVVAFWDAHCQPEDGFGNLTIAALVENGSPPALELFVSKLLDRAHDEDDKLEWLRQDVLPHRQDVGLIRAGRDALARGLGPPLDLALVQVFFDYRPEEWYAPANQQQPPDRAAMSGPVVSELRALAAQAQKQVALDERTAKVIQTFIPSNAP